MTTYNSRKYPLSNRTRYGPYNIIEKYVDGHRVFDYVPTSYGSEYDLSELDQSKQRKYYSPTMITQRYYESSLDDEEYIVTSRRPRIYYEAKPRSDIIEYVYQEDLRPKFEEYVIQDRTPRKRYIEEISPRRSNVNSESLPPINRSPRPVQSIENLSPRRSIMKEQTPRISPMRNTPRKILSQNKHPSKYVSLKEVLAENRARRGSRIPKPRREVDEEQLHDLPTYNKNFIKNGFLVHK